MSISVSRGHQRPLVLDPSQLYSIAEASAALDQSRPTTYADIDAGRLASIVMGRRRKISGAEVIRRAQQIVSESEVRRG
jgi:excisionase family DNA binding protein